MTEQAWIRISDKPVIYPAWLATRDFKIIEWHDKPYVTMCWFHWQPAPAAPKPPVDEEKQIMLSAKAKHFEVWGFYCEGDFEAGYNAGIAHARTKSKPQAGEGEC